MSDCPNCPVEKECFYQYKPCDCFNQRKFTPEPEKSVKPVEKIPCPRCQNKPEEYELDLFKSNEKPACLWCNGTGQL